MGKSYIIKKISTRICERCNAEFEVSSVSKLVLCEHCREGQRREKASQQRRNELLTLPWTERVRKLSEESFSNYLQQKYHIDMARYLAMKREQKNKCAICGMDGNLFTRGLYVDHNHATGAVRGLLCPDCNFALGWFKDDVERLKSAIIYLQKYDFWDIPR